MSTSRQRSRGGGFTLVEVLVALGLSVVLLGAVQGLLVQIARTSAALARQGADDARRELPLTLLGQDLAQLLAAGSLSVHDQRLSLTTLNSLQAERLAARHAVEVRYAAAPAADGALQLLRQEWELGQSPPEDGAVVLSSDVAALTFEVFDGQRWQTQWPPSVPRAAGALRVVCRWRDGTVAQRVFRLAPLAWRRHDA